MLTTVLDLGQSFIHIQSLGGSLFVVIKRHNYRVCFTVPVSRSMWTLMMNKWPLRHTMLRFVIVTFEILALIMILRSAFVQYWLSDMQTTTSQWMHGISMTIDNQQLAQFRNEISAHFQDLNQPQTEYLYKITSTKAALKHFNQYYCHAGDKNPYIYGVNLRLVCGEISRKGILNKFS